MSPAPSVGATARATRLFALKAERHAEEVFLGVAPGVKGKTGADEASEHVEDALDD